MAFKREGDDLSQLAALRRRRVADLLASFIPEDEALLLNNGRYACSVCSRRPVFDTVDMLAVHRTGKKHITCLQRYYGKKNSLQKEIQKRQHQRHIQEQESGSGTRPEQDQLPPLLQRTREITRHALLREAPYSSRCKRKQGCGGEGRSPCPSTSGAGVGVGAGMAVVVPRTTGNSSTASDTSVGTAAATADAGGDSSAGTGTPGKGKHSGRRNKATSTTPTPAPDPEKQRLAEYQLQLRSAGWIPDGCGRWVRDAAAEFDSDEEDPPPLPPPLTPSSPPHSSSSNPHSILMP